jgi:hypothetical protein
MGGNILHKPIGELLHPPRVFGHITPGAQTGSYYASPGDVMSDATAKLFRTKEEALEFIGAKGKDYGEVAVNSHGHKRIIERRF